MDEFHVVSPKEREWNEFLSKVPNANIFQTPEMKKVYEATKGYTPISIGIANQNNELVATFLGIVINVKSGLLKPFATWSTARGGPLYLSDSKSDIVQNLLIETFEKHVKQNGSQYSRIYMLFNPDENVANNFNKNKWIKEDSFNFLLDLSLGKDSIWNGMHKARRYGVRKGFQNKISIEEIVDKSAVDIFYDLYSSMTKRNKITTIDKSFFDSVFDSMSHKNFVKFLFAKHSDKYISGKIILNYNNCIYNWFAATTEDSYKFYANDSFDWYIIEEGIKNGYKFFDFGGAGTQIQGGKVEGIFKYKKQFGGDLVNFGRFKKVHNHAKYLITDTMFPVYRKIARRL